MFPTRLSSGKGFAAAEPVLLSLAAMPLDSADDAELLRAHSRGDLQAFARLYDRYDRSCFQFVRRMLGAGHAAMAEDVHQEVWIAISKSTHEFDAGRGTFAAWLFTIARRKVLDHFRRQKVVPLRTDFDDDVLMVADPGPTPLDRVTSRELAERLVCAVEALPLEQRGTFILFADAGLSLEEVAQATGVAVETAKSRLRYARAKLKLALAGERTDHV